jgi:Uma2 family endonuclease
MTAPVKVRVSEEEYLATMTGEKPSLEFVNGEVFQKPMTKESHLLVVDEVLAALRAYRQRTGGMSGPEGTVNLSLGPDRRYRVPDAAYWGPDRPRTGGVFVPPTAAIEVRSEGQSMAELRDKCREYLARGVDVCWLIDPDAQVVEAFEGDADGAPLPPDGVLVSAHLPGFELPVSELWASLD